MSSIIDSIFCLVVGGIVVVLLNVLMSNLKTSTGNQTLNTIVQSNLTEVTNIIDNDFRKMGYKVAKPPGDSAIVYADTSKIKMKGDFYDAGRIDTVQYSVGSKPSGNINPSTRYLVRLMRSVGDTSISMNLGVTRFKLTYYDGSGNPITATPNVANPSAISIIKLQVNVQSQFLSEIRVFKSPTPPETTFVSAAWEQTLRPRNLK